MANLGLTDILRTHAGKKGKPIFTRLSATRNSRLDRWYCAHHEKSRYSSEIDTSFLPPHFSDHIPIALSIRTLKSRDWGPGYNRINKSVLTQPHVLDEFKALLSDIPDTLSDPHANPTEIQDLWENLKIKSQVYSKRPPVPLKTKEQP